MGHMIKETYTCSVEPCGNEVVLERLGVMEKIIDNIPAGWIGIQYGGGGFKTVFLICERHEVVVRTMEEDESEFYQHNATHSAAFQLVTR